MSDNKKSLTEEDIVGIAMEIILMAGDGRTCTQEALKHAKAGDFTVADAKVQEARDYICKAHNAQTELVSLEVSGECEINPTILLNHAQDTLMTIMSEINLTTELIDVLRLLYEKGVLS